MTDKEVMAGAIGFVIGGFIFGLSIALLVDDGWRKFCVSKNVATYVQCETSKGSSTTVWAWKDEK